MLMKCNINADISKQWQNIIYIALEVYSPIVSLMESTLPDKFINYKIVYIVYKVVCVNYKNFIIFKHVTQKKEEVI